MTLLRCNRLLSVIMLGALILQSSPSSLGLQRARFTRARSLVLSKHAIEYMAFNPDGSLLAVSDAEGKVYLAVFEEQLKFTLLPRKAIDLAFDPLSGYLATSLPGNIIIRPLSGSNRQIALTTSRYAYRPLEFLSDGSALLVGCDDAPTRMWFRPDFVTSRAINLPHTQGAGPVGVSSNKGNHVVIGVTNGFIVYQCDKHSRRVTRLAWQKNAHKGHTNVATFTGKGTRIITSGDDGTIKLWDETARKPIRTIRLRHGVPIFVKSLTDGRLVSVAEARRKPGEPEEANRVWLFRESDGKVLHTLALSNRPTCAALHPFKGLLVIGTENGSLNLFKMRK